MSHGDPYETIPMDGELLRGAGDHGRGWSEVRDQVPASIRDASFPTAVRGYDRRAVDTYVERVNRLIAEIEVSRSPAAAVRHALDRVGEQTSAILQRARSTAEEITTSAREEAEEITARSRDEAEEILTTATEQADELLARTTGQAEDVVARAQAQAEQTLTEARAEADATLKEARTEAQDALQRSRQEAATLRQQAEARVKALDAEADAISTEREKLVEDIREIAARLADVVSNAADFAPVPESTVDDIVGESGAVVDADAVEAVAVDDQIDDGEITAVVGSDEATQVVPAIEEPQAKQLDLQNGPNN